MTASCLARSKCFKVGSLCYLDCEFFVTKSIHIGFGDHEIYIILYHYMPMKVVIRDYVKQLIIAKYAWADCITYRFILYGDLRQNVKYLNPIVKSYFGIC